MYILSLYLDGPLLHSCFIKAGRHGIEIQNIEGPDSNVKPQYKTPKIEAISGGPEANVKRLYIEKGRVVSGLSAQHFLLNTLEVKASGRYAEEALAFQSEATSHFDPARVLQVPFIQKSEKEKTEALLFTVPRESLQRHLEEIGKWGFDPDVVSAAPLALCHFARWKFPELTEALIIHIGSFETTCALMEKGKLKRAHAIPFGVEALLAALFEDRKKILLKKEIEGAAKQLDLLLLKEGLTPNLSARLNELRQEIGKTQQRFSSPRMIFTGRIDTFLHLSEYLGGSSELLSSEEQRFAIPIGLALEQTSPTSLQLRKEEFFPTKNWKKLGQWIAALAISSTLLGGAILAWGQHLIHVKKKETFRFLNVSEKGIDGWISAIESHNKEYPYILQAILFVFLDEHHRSIWIPS